MPTYSESEQVIRRLSQITNAYDDGFEEQIKALLTMGLERFNLDIGILSRIEEDRYIIEQCVCPAEVPLKPGDAFTLGLTYCSVTCACDKHLALEKVGISDLLGKHPAYQEFGLESYIGIPIKFRGELYGTLNFSSAAPYPRQFRDIDIDSLHLMASWIEVELVRRQQEKELRDLNQKLEALASKDSLTQLANRRTMFKQLRKALNYINRTQGHAAIAMLDIDHFKKINDTYGHQMGDQILKAVADVLSNALRDYDFIARYGGEEFLLWLPDTTAEQATRICQRLKDDISHLSLLKTPITLSAGICAFQGYACADTNVDTHLDRLIAIADDTLYAAKDAGRNCIRSQTEIRKE